MKYILLLLFFVSCHPKLHKDAVALSKKQNSKDGLVFNWFLLEPIEDSTSGICINKAYEFVNNKKHKTVIIALLDCSIDNNHATLTNKFWSNRDEIPNNDIDDDENGYIDDTNGWNFLGTKDPSEMVLNSSTDAIRIIRQFKKDSILFGVNNENKLNGDNYSKAIKRFRIEVEKNKTDISDSKYFVDTYAEAKKNVIIPYFNNENYTLEQLQAIKSKDTLVENSIYFLSKLIEYDMTKEWINSFSSDSHKASQTTYNFDYNERDLINKWSNDIENIAYGHNNVFCNLDMNSHATRVGAVIAGIGNDNISDGILKNVELMPVVIGPYSGNEDDKDIALSIRYAVDNGAKVINMSFGKPISHKSELVFDAIKYAESKNVLLVTSAGNNAENGDLEENFRYPNDNDFGKPEVADNFLMVGSTGPKVDSTFVSSFSNYGKKNVDLFAPGSEFITAWPNNTYKKDGGTSIASAVVSAVAGLLFQYYPNLTASKVKHILMDSGIAYDLEVYVGSGKNKKKLPFNELSKSGKVVNAYNAILMADEISKKL